jgi:hypothetical protein
MPRNLSASVAVRAKSDKFSLCLNVTHHLAVGSGPNTTYLRNCHPDDVDVVLATNLVLTLSGKVDNVRIPSETIIKSAIAHHLRAYLKLVCLLNVIKIYAQFLSSERNETWFTHHF